MNNPENIPNLVTGAGKAFNSTGLAAAAKGVPVPEVPVAPQPPSVGGEMVPAGVISVFGQEFQKKHVYILGAILILVVGLMAWKWYSKPENDDEDDDDEMEELGYGGMYGLPGGMPGGMQGMMPPPGWRPEHEHQMPPQQQQQMPQQQMPQHQPQQQPQQQMPQQQMPQQQMQQMPQQAPNSMNDQQFDEQMEQAMQNV